MKQLMQAHILPFEFPGYFGQKHFPDLSLFLEFVEGVFILPRCLLTGFRPFQQFVREISVIQRVQKRFDAVFEQPPGFFFHRVTPFHLVKPGTQQVLAVGGCAGKNRGQLNADAFQFGKE
jgi:hypothetical protein